MLGCGNGWVCYLSDPIATHELDDLLERLLEQRTGVAQVHETAEQRK